MYYFPVKDPYNTARLVRFLSLKLFCMCLLTGGKREGEVVHFIAQLKRALITPNKIDMGQDRTTWPWSTSTKRCAHNQCTPHSKPWQGKRVEASLSGHSCLVALCSLAFSQVGH